MALTAYYVDSDIGTDTGAGTTGDPYGNIQHALDTVTRDSTNGDIFYGKGSETLGGIINDTTYGTPTSTAPCVLAKWDADWTLTAQDSTTGLLDSSMPYTYFYDIIFNCNGRTNGQSFDPHTSCVVHKCVFHNSAYNNANGMCDLNTTYVDCHFYNAYYAGRGNSGSRILGCHFEDIETSAIWTNGGGGHYSNNTFDLSAHAGATAFEINSGSQTITNNSIYQSAGTGTGIETGSGSESSVIANNLIEGFSGTGGVAFDIQSTGTLLIANAAYNNTTDFNKVGNLFLDLDNESLGASPFAKSGAGTYANRGTYFAPQDTGNVLGGA